MFEKIKGDTNVTGEVGKAIERISFYLKSPQNKANEIVNQLGSHYLTGGELAVKMNQISEKDKELLVKGKELLAGDTSSIDAETLEALKMTVELIGEVLSGESK